MAVVGESGRRSTVVQVQGDATSHDAWRRNLIDKSKRSAFSLFFPDLQSYAVPSLTAIPSLNFYHSLPAFPRSHGELSCKFSVDLGDVIGPLSVLGRIAVDLLGRGVDTRIRASGHSHRARCCDYSHVCSQFVLALFLKLFLHSSSCLDHSQAGRD